MAVADRPYFDLPPGIELGWRNRRIIAARVGWPDGALEACEAIERARPDWDPTWRFANVFKGFEAPAGFYATRHAIRLRGERPVYGADPAALLAAIEAVVSCCPACGLRYPIPAGSDIPQHDVPGTDRGCGVHWSRTTVEISSGECPDEDLV